ncbi:hypothetical protein J4416_05135 [Candidatus Pacearchaeota archaeon]|nr:hypothetical protein [Candidatus Pacearchaeota archaeon]
MKKLIFALMLLTVLLIAGCSKTDVQTIDNQVTGEVVKQVPSSVVVQFDGNVANHANYGYPLLVRWKVTTDIPVDSGYTDLRYDYVPMVDDGELNINSYSFKSDTYTTGYPGKFEINIKPPKTGVMRIRAHVNLNGVDYWSKESTIAID